MPVAMTDYIQSVEINDTVYVGGGFTDRDEDEYIVIAFNTQSCQWHTLPPYSTKRFAMTTINNKLVVVGGINRDFSGSSKLGEWQPDSNQWTRPFPPMSTPRYGPSATSYTHWLVVAGGYYGVRLHTVEVLDVSNMQWSTGPSTPTPWSGIKSLQLEILGTSWGDGLRMWVGVLMSTVYLWRLLFLTSHQTVPTYGTNYLHSTVSGPVHSTLEDIYWQSVVRT